MYFGWPIQHSRSPLIHGYWLKEYSSKMGAKDIRAIEPENFERFIKQDLPGLRLSS